jgi:ribonuclease HI
MYLILHKANGWRSSSGKIVTNKDLFCTLDEAISKLERDEIKVGFWWIDRQVHAT